MEGHARLPAVFNYHLCFFRGDFRISKENTVLDIPWHPPTPQHPLLIFQTHCCSTLNRLTDSLMPRPEGWGVFVEASAKTLSGLSSFLFIDEDKTSPYQEAAWRPRHRPVCLRAICDARNSFILRLALTYPALSTVSPQCLESRDSARRRHSSF